MKTITLTQGQWQMIMRALRVLAAPYPAKMRDSKEKLAELASIIQDELERR